VEKRILEERIREYRRRRIDSMMDELLKSAGVNETG
jgi:hypothetical protein